MKWFALLAPVFVVACATSPGRLVPYTKQGADALSQNETSCETRGFTKGSDSYLNCLRKLADNEGYWLLVARGNLQFVAQPVGYRQPPTLFEKGGHLDVDEEPKPATALQTLDMTGTWNMFLLSKTSLEACTFQQTGNELTGFCKDVLGNQGPIAGSVDGQRVGWRWLHSRSVDGYNFVVELFAGTVDSNGKLGGGFETYSTFDIFHPTFDIAWSTPPIQRFTNRFDAEKLPIVEADYTRQLAFCLSCRDGSGRPKSTTDG
jgi:hypothetical protein